MTIRDHRRIDPVARAYTVPIVREVPIGQAPDNGTPGQLAQPLLYTADSHAW